MAVSILTTDSIYQIHPINQDFIWQLQESNTGIIDESYKFVADLYVRDQPTDFDVVEPGTFTKVGRIKSYPLNGGAVGAINFTDIARNFVPSFDYTVETEWPDDTDPTFYDEAYHFNLFDFKIKYGYEIEVNDELVIYNADGSPLENDEFSFQSDLVSGLDAALWYNDYFLDYNKNSTNTQNHHNVWRFDAEKVYSTAYDTSWDVTTNYTDRQFLTELKDGPYREGGKYPLPIALLAGRADDNGHQIADPYVFSYKFYNSDGLLLDTKYVYSVTRENMGAWRLLSRDSVINQCPEGFKMVDFKGDTKQLRDNQYIGVPNYDYYTLQAHEQLINNWLNYPQNCLRYDTEWGNFQLAHATFDEVSNDINLNQDVYGNINVSNKYLMDNPLPAGDIAVFTVQNQVIITDDSGAFSVEAWLKLPDNTRGGRWRIDVLSGQSVVSSNYIDSIGTSPGWQNLYVNCQGAPNTAALVEYQIVLEDYVLGKDGYEGGFIYLEDMLLIRQGEIFRNDNTLYEYKSEPYTESYRFDWEPDCQRNDTQHIIWKNAYGGYDGYTFKGRNIKTMQVNKDTYRTDEAYDGQLFHRTPTMLGNTDFNIRADHGVELTTDYLSKNEREWFEQLIKSPNIFLYKEGLTDELIPMRLLTTQYAVIPQVNQSLYQLKIELIEAMPRATQNGFTRPRII